MGRRKVIFYLVDGARPDVLSRLIESGTLPNIAQYLVQEGSYTKGSTCFPSTTGPAYLPFLTGTSPGDHDITGIRWFDKKEYFRKNRWSRNAMRSYCGYEAKFFNDDMNTAYPSLFEEYDRGFNIYNMITKGVKPENDLTQKGKTKLYFRAHFYHEHHPVDLAGHDHLMRSLEMDPEFVFAVFPSVDWDAHTYHYEDEKTIEAYKIADRSLGAVVNRLKEQGVYEDTLIVMASDHGLTSTHTHLDLGKYFKKQGYRVLEYPTIGKLLPNMTVFISGNSFASLSFLDKKEDYYRVDLLQNHGKALNAFVQEDAIDFILYRQDTSTVVIHNKNGTALVKTHDDGRLSYHPETTDVLGIGEVKGPIDFKTALDLTFETDYPDSLFQIHQLMKSHRAGDVIVSAAVGYDLRDYWELPEHKGSHGSLHKDHLHVPILTNKKNLISSAVRTTHVHGVIKEWLD